MAMQECKRAILGKALEDLVARARSGKEPCRIGLMASGNIPMRNSSPPQAPP